jgi:hypothetical protein
MNKKDIFSRPDYIQLPANRVCEFADKCQLPCRINPIYNIQSAVKEST